jgi:5'-3' exonuclease
LNRNLLILDVPFLAHRAKHTTGTLSHQGIKTGIVFGILRDLANFRELFQSTHVAFCFDRGESKRVEIFPDYKKKRYDAVLDEDHLYLRTKIRNLYDDHLPGLGFKNVFVETGYEADDLIASVVKGMGQEDEAVIVSADKDLWQLIGKDVVVYNPITKKVTNRKALLDKHGIHPCHWATVKAIAGCRGDGIPGVEGVGETTACKFVLGQLKANSAKRLSILQGEGFKVWQRNAKLVALPFEGTRECRVVDDDVSRKRWKELCRSMGFVSLEGKMG